MFAQPSHHMVDYGVHQLIGIVIALCTLRSTQGSSKSLRSQGLLQPLMHALLVDGLPLARGCCHCHSGIGSDRYMEVCSACLLLMMMMMMMVTMRRERSSCKPEMLLLCQSELPLW